MSWGGGGEVQKKDSRKGKLNEKNSCGPIKTKKYSYMEFDSEKQFLRLENAPPPHNFSNGPSLKFGEGDTLRCRKILVACQNFEH